MADKLKWADVAHMYVLSDIEGLQNWGPNSIHPKAPKSVLVTLDALRLSTIFDGVVEFTPILRAMEDMTDEEHTELVLLILNHGLEDPISVGELNYEPMPYPDMRGIYTTMVTARCFEANIEFHPNGGVLIKHEDGKIELPSNAAEIIHWYVSHGFNVFDLEWGTEAIRKEDRNG